MSILVGAREKCSRITFRGWYLAANGTIANVVYHQLNLYFQGHTFQVAIVTSKGWQNANVTIAIT